MLSGFGFWFRIRGHNLADFKCVQRRSVRLR